MVKAMILQKRKPSTRYFDQLTEEGPTQLVNLTKKTKQKFGGDEIAFEANNTTVSVQKHAGNKVLKPNVRIQLPKVPKEMFEKYARGDAVQTTGVRTKFFKEKQRRKEIQFEYATEQAARAEVLLTEQSGFLEPDEDELTTELRQDQIAKNVDIMSATKRFDLQLEHGPYMIRYTRNGRHLLLGGRKGHVAALDWHIKKLKCEMNVDEKVSDVSWLHVDTMFACAQKQWVYIYDHQGTELHCVKRQYCVEHMEFLPYNFLLSTTNDRGYLTWLDISIGEFAGTYNTKMGSIRAMRQNPANGVICIGGGRGVVSMWSPKMREPLAKMFCHTATICSLTVDPRGQNMVTAGTDGRVKVWDIRALNGPLISYRLALPATNVEVSEKGILAFSQGTNLSMYRSVLHGRCSEDSLPYLRHRFDSHVECMRFCPYEDIIGVGTANGFSSLLVPGSGEPNFDAFEANPFETKSQRREKEVQGLLTKIPADLITLDPNTIVSVDEPTLQQKIESKQTLFHLKPPQIELNSKRRNKMKGKGGTAQAARSKQIVKYTKRREFITELRAAKRAVIQEHRQQTDNDDVQHISKVHSKEKKSVLDRFKPKNKNSNPPTKN